jgi:hypothetical protein
MSPRRESSLGPVCWRRDRRATRRCDADFRSAGDTEDELQPSAGGSALSGSGRGDSDRQFTRGDVRCIRARTDAEVSRSTSTLEATPTPNQAMQLTATRFAINIYRDYNLSTAINARSR